MGNILITGATGNIGCEIIRYLYKNDTSNRIIAGVRSIEKAKNVFADYPNLDYVHSYISSIYFYRRFSFLQAAT